MKLLSFLPLIPLALLAQAQTSGDHPKLQDDLKRFPEADPPDKKDEGAGHSFFNQDKYCELTIVETDQFLSGLDWLEKRP